MKARFTWIAVFAVLCSSAASAQTDTATTTGTTPALTQDTAGMGAGTTAPVAPDMGTDTAGMSAAAPPMMTDTGTMMAEQMPADTAITTSTTTTDVEEEEEGGFDWNWLGLLGLLGLTGLFKKRNTDTTIVHHDTVRPVDRNDPPGTRPRV